MLRCLITKRRFVVEFPTPKAFHSKAQGRAAHPGMTINTRRKPQRGFTGNCVKPRWGLVLHFFQDPGCAARPWALLLNRVAVRQTAQHQNLRFGLVLAPPHRTRQGWPEEGFHSFRLAGGSREIHLFDVDCTSCSALSILEG